MHPLKVIRTSLEVGFPESGKPEFVASFRGRDFRSIGSLNEFPYEDAQFDVVLMDGSAVSPLRVKESHRVLKAEGCLYFQVPEKTKQQDGYTLPEIYALVRHGFNIVGVERPAWWLFGRHGRTITICAQKKNWKSLRNIYRPLV